jgi:hypothetical protein
MIYTCLLWVCRLSFLFLKILNLYCIDVLYRFEWMNILKKKSLWCYSFLIRTMCYCLFLRTMCYYSQVDHKFYINYFLSIISPLYQLFWGFKDFFYNVNQSFVTARSWKAFDFFLSTFKVIHMIGCDLLIV